MVSHRRSFTTPTTAPDDVVTFELNGEEFRCLPIAPAGVLNRLTACVRMDDRGRQTFDGLNLLAFLEGVLVEEDVPKLQRLTDARDVVIPIETIGEIVLWLSEEVYGNRPTS